MVTKLLGVLTRKNFKRVFSLLSLFIAFVLPLSCVFVCPVSASSSDLMLADLFDNPCTAIQVHSTESVTLVDGFSNLYEFKTTQGASSGNSSIPVTWYFSCEWFTGSSVQVVFSFICNNPAFIQSVVFGLGSTFVTCSRSVSNGVVTCTASVPANIVSSHFSITINLDVVDDPYHLYFQFLDCSVSAFAAETHYFEWYGNSVYSPYNDTYIESEELAIFCFSADDCITYDYPSAVSLGKPFLGNYNLQSPLPGAGESQYLSLQVDVDINGISGDTFYLVNMSFPGSLIYASVSCGDELTPVVIPVTVNSFVSDGSVVDVTTDRAVHAYRISGTQNVLKSALGSTVNDSGTSSFIKWDDLSQSYKVYNSYDFGSFIYSEEDAYLYTTESWESQLTGSALYSSRVGVSWNSYRDYSTYTLHLGILLPVYPNEDEDGFYRIDFAGSYSASIIDRGQVSIDTAYLSDIISGKSDELIYTIKQFFPNATELNNVVSEVNSAANDIHQIELDALDSMNDLRLDYDSYRDVLDNFIDSDNDAFLSGFNLITVVLKMYIDAYAAGNMLWVFARIAFFGVAAYVVSRGRAPKHPGGG